MDEHDEEEGAPTDAVGDVSSSPVAVAEVAPPGGTGASTRAPALPPRDSEGASVTPPQLPAAARAGAATGAGDGVVMASSSGQLPASDSTLATMARAHLEREAGAVMAW